MTTRKENNTEDALLLTGHAGLLARDFWLEKVIAGDQHELTLWPNANDAGEMDELSVELDEKIGGALDKITGGREQGLNVFLLSVYLILLYKYKGAVSPVAGISVKWTDEGNSTPVNELVPLVTEISGGLTVKVLLGLVQQEIANCLRYGNYPLKEIDKLQGTRVSATLCENAFYTTCDRQLQMSESKGQIIFAPLKLNGKIILRFNLNRHLPFTIRAFTEHFLFILSSSISNINARLSEIILREPAQPLNRSTYVFPEKHVLDFWNSSINRFRENTAIQMHEKSFTYLEADKAADKLASYLAHRLGVKNGDRVIVLLAPSEMLPVSLLAIFNPGAVYVPVDPSYPASRIGFIYSEVKPAAVIGEDMERWPFIDGSLRLNLCEKWEQISNDAPQNFAPALLQKSDLAYIIYTSGTTGFPKGVMVEHGNLANFLAHIKYHIPHSEEFRLPLLASHAFDISIYQVMLPLVSGGMLEILEKQEITDFERLKELFSSVNAIDTVPALFAEITGMFKPGEPVSDAIKHVFVGGDRVSDKLLHDLRIAFPAAFIIVQYGPTEATIFCTSICYAPTGVKMKGAVIGRPIINAGIFLADADGNLVPEGVAGEILISGDCVAKGYWNNPVQSEQRFTKSMYGNVFKTGDKARCSINGEIEFLGRSDDQVKIRGYRIETGEVEGALQAYPGIKQSAIAVTEDTAGQKILAAAYTSEGIIQEEKIRTFLAGRLPVYMIPELLIGLAELPLTANGKIDKKSIAEAAKRRTMVHEEIVAPVSTMEKKLMGIWQTELAKNEIGITGNFFDAGGHSLKAARIAAKIARELNIQASVQDIFFYPTVQSLANFLQTGKRVSWGEKIVKLPEQPSYELSDGQRRMWVLSQFEEVSAAYNTPAAFYIQGTLDTAALCEAVKTLVGRHEILRTVFIETDEKPVQKILDQASLDACPEMIDLRNCNEPMQTARAAIAEKATVLFDLSKGPLFTTSLYHIDEDSYVLFFNMHHIISDGWSMEVLVTEMLALYNAFTHRLRNPLPPLRFQFRDFAVWQARMMNDQRMEESKAYWLDKLSGGLPVIDLPMDYKRPPVKNYKGAIQHFELAVPLMNEFDLLARKNDSTLFMAFQSVLNILIYKYTGDTDIVLGSPLAGRNHAELENQVGFYVNTIVLRSAVSGDDVFTDVLKRVRQTTLEAYEHQFYPFDRLVDELSISRDQSRTPVFNILVTLDYESASASDWLIQCGLEITPFIQDFSTSKYDITFRVTHRGDKVMLSIEYDTALFSAQRIAQIAGHLSVLMNAVTADPGKRIGMLDYLEPAELNTLLHEYNRPWHPIGETVNYFTGFEKQVAANPENIAVSCEAYAFTYSEIDLMSNAAASRLRNNYGLAPESKVGIFVNRSSKIIPILTGLFKSRMIYVPIDPNYPLPRIRYIIEDSGIQHIICSSSLLTGFAQMLEGISLIPENELLELKGEVLYTPRTIHHRDLAYIIYTSGSTGNPKGVMIDHGNLVALMEWAAREFETTPFDTVYAVTSYCFDLSVFEFFFPLYTGRQVTILESGVNIEFHLQQEDKRVLLNTVPSLIDVLLKEKVSLEKVKAINMAGEAVPPSFKDKIDYRLIETRNLYGPSEDTTYSTNYRFTDDGHAVPIGKPVDNTTVYILDKNGMLTPPGMKGEIYLAGTGLAQGYLNDPLKTAEKFIQWPVNPSVRLYRTGDFGRWLPDGNIEFAGREDAQVKLNGFRIELGEIETAMGRFNGLKNPVALVKKGKDGAAFIAAYYISDNESPTPDAVKSALVKQLPAFLIPQYIIRMDKMPFTPNGKLDKNALPYPDLEEEDIRQTDEPVTETEMMLSDTWKQLLDKTELDLSADFFTMGGNSIKAVAMISRIRKKTGVEIGLGELFRFPTIRSLSAFLDQQEKNVYEPVVPVPKSSGYTLSSSQASLLLLSMLDEQANIAYNMPFLYQLDGPVDKILLKECMDALIRRHEILRTTYSQTEGSLLQHVHEKIPAVFRIEKLHEDTEASFLKALNLVKKDIQLPFDLSNGPLCRALFIELTENKSLFLFNIHHIACDGWSLKILMDELFLWYRSGTAAQAGEMPLKIQYKDYAAWQNRQLENGNLKTAQNFWSRHLADDIQPLKLPVVVGSSSLHHRQSGVGRFVIDQELLQKLEKVNAESHTTLFMLLKASLDLLLYQYTGNTDLLTGTPVANRQHPDLVNQVGYYLNMLPLRIKLSGKDSFETLLGKVKNNLIEAFRFQQYPFDKMVADYRGAGKNRPPLDFDVVIDMVDYYAADEDAYQLTRDLNIRMINMEEAHHSRFNLTVYLYKKNTYVEVVLEYNQGLYRQVTINKMISRYQSVLEEIAAGSGMQKSLDDFAIAKPVTIPAISSLQGFKK